MLERDLPGDTQGVSQATQDIQLRLITQDEPHINTVETYTSHDSCYSESLTSMEGRITGW